MTKYYGKYLALFMGMGSYATFLPVYLENYLNFSSSKVGIILSIPSILGIVFVPIWGIIADISNKKKTVLFINLLMSLLLTLVYITSKSFLSVFIVCALLEIFRSPLLPLIDSMSTTYCKENNKNYGSIRVLGSLSFAVSSFLCGYIIKITNNNLFFFYVLIVSMIACLLITPRLTTNCLEDKKEKVNLKDDLFLLFKNKKFIIILLCAISISGLTESMMSYQGIHLINLGASTQLVGLLVVFMVMPELFFMVKTKSLLDKYGIVKMLSCASFLLLIRWTIYYFTSLPIVFMIATAMHGVAISILTICAFDFIGKVVDDKLHTTAMTVYTFITGISYSLMKLLFGNMIDILGIKSVFLLCIVISLCSFGIFAILKNMLSQSVELDVV